MSKQFEDLQRAIAEMAVLIEQNDSPDSQIYTLFFQHPEFAFQLVELIDNLDEQLMDDNSPIYSACIFALDVCVAQLQAATEVNNKTVSKSLSKLMNYLASIINTHKHSLSFWLPVLNIFYEVHVELTAELKEAYFELASQEDDTPNEEHQFSHLEAIRDLIHELSDLSIFDIAENFFAQSYAMPADFFADLIIDLYHIEEGQDIALLTLLHPKADVREVAMATLDEVLKQVKLSSISLSRLQIIKYWYPTSYHTTFDHWIKNQRKKGVTFAAEPVQANMSIKATEIDGTGSQGLFVHIRTNRKNRICGLLLKSSIGLKDAWVTPLISAKDLASYYKQAFEENVTLRIVDNDYFKLMVEHFLAVTSEQGEVPSLHFLEVQELLGVRLKPKKLDMEQIFAQLSIAISPFTPETIKNSLKRSKAWLKNKPFTESWYLESPLIDKIVNHNSSFINGVKICCLEDAMRAVFAQEMEVNREQWQFHFLWVALWAKAKPKSNEKIWEDSFLIAYTIRNNLPLDQIPVMQEICYQTVINSVETMQERKTHLSKE